MATNAVKDL